MEVFVDFGLFEVLVGLGLAAAARVLYSHRAVGIGVLLASAAAPVALVVLAPGGAIKWLAVLCLGTGLMNATVVLGAMKSGGVPRLLEGLRLRRPGSGGGG